jgi:hypothetical protein
MPAGPCKLCGATNYSLSLGGIDICPACDCGTPPEVSYLRRQLEEANLKIIELTQENSRLKMKADRK